MKFLLFHIILSALLSQQFIYAQQSYEVKKNKAIEKPLAKRKSAKALFLLAKLYDEKNKADSSFKYYKKALIAYNTTNKIDSVMLCNIRVFKLLNSQDALKVDPLPYLTEYSIYATTINDTLKMIEAKKLFASYYFTPKAYQKSKVYYKTALKLASSINDSLNLAKINTNLGLLYSGFINNDSAYYFFDRALKLYKKEHKRERFSVYYNYANSYQKEKKNHKAIQYLLKANSIELGVYKKKYKQLLYYKLSICYSEINNFKKAHSYLQKSITLKDSINTTKQNIAISEIMEKYDNEKLKNDNLISESKRKQNRNFLYGSLALLFFGGITTILFLKNSKRKRLLAEKNNEIEQQKVVTLLKEQELKSIDAMIEGQEKERKRIAEDLHDDLGSVLTTLKLHFENYKINKEKKKFQEDELIEKTDALLDEAYNKVRGIAHAKNSGVIANQGLLLAIENMADKVSSSKKIKIEVVNHGLENRLENSLELTIFRIIQELITNIIKHAEATQAIIHIINHENSLNIMVEDNGKGLNTSQISSKGMGLHSIDKRIEYLDGNLTIESEKSKGTTVIIDIPL